jgi:DNA-binding PadR family transcriptional regulator
MSCYIAIYLDISAASGPAKEKLTMFHPHRRFWGPWSESPFQKGDLKYVILDLLKDGPRHGYEVITVLKERSHGFYAPSPGAVYPTLQLLEEMGYVTAEQRDAKKVYTITDEGRKFLAEQGQPAESIRSRMRSHWNPESAAEIREIMADIGTLARLVGQHSRTADQEKMRRVRDVVAKARSEIETLLNQQP